MKVVIRETLFHPNGARQAYGARTVDPDTALEVKIGRWQFWDDRGTVLDEIDVGDARWARVAALTPDVVVDVLRMTKLPRTWISEAARAIAWENLSDPDPASRHASGTILHQMPSVLEGLAAEDEALRDRAFGLVFHETYRDGSIFEISSLVAPFLFRLLAEGRSDATRILQTLFRYAEVLASPPPRVVPMWRGRASGIFLANASVLVDCLARPLHDTAFDRLVAILALPFWEGRTLASALASRLPNEGDLVRRARLARALGDCAKQGDPSTRTIVRGAFARETSPVAALVLALAIVETCPSDERPPPDVVATLADAVVAPATGLASMYAAVAGDDAVGALAARVATALGRSVSSDARSAACARIFPVVLAAVRKADLFEVFELLLGLLQMTQPRTEAEIVPSLVTMRRAVLEAILALDEEAWSWAELGEILAGFGLPSSHDARVARSALLAVARRAEPFVRFD